MSDVLLLLLLVLFGCRLVPVLLFSTCCLLACCVTGRFCWLDQPVIHLGYAPLHTFCNAVSLRPYSFAAAICCRSRVMELCGMGPAAVNAAPQPARRRLLVEVVEGVPLDEIVNPLLDEWW